MDPPTEPNQSDCCGSGCNPCIFDVYQQQLQRYNQNRNLNLTETISQNCISQLSYSVFRLTSIENDSFDTNLYTFQYVKRHHGAEPANVSLRYNGGQHFLLRGLESENRYFTRAYTPIRINNVDSSFVVLIKLYPNGKMSNFIQQLRVGCEMLWRGPYGSYNINYNLKNVAMICQGTGIAPMYSITSDLVSNEQCETFVKLFYCCKNIKSIHLRQQLYELSSYWNFTYEIFLSEINDVKCKYNEIIHREKLNFDYLNNYFQIENFLSDFQVLVCGSEAFSEQIVENVRQCGINRNFVFVF